jgi:hypothetical protein
MKDHRKELLWTGLILALAGLALFSLGGCCPRTNETTGVTTKSFLNCLQTGQEMVCDPPAEVMTVVEIAAPLVTTLVNALAPGTAAFINAQTALNEIQSIQQFGCLAVTALNNLVAYLNTTFGPTASLKMAGAPVINVKPLVDWKHAHGYL